MIRDELLHKLFDGHWAPTHIDTNSFVGRARVGERDLTVIGTANRAEVGADLCLKMAAAVLDTVEHRPGEAILFLLDTQGQRLRRHDELLGLNGYMAHLAKCVEVARRHGHPILSLVYGEAVSGGYLTTGMMADACYALDDAEIKVMNLPAMSRITKIPLERLEALSQHSPVFSPGVANYLKMGHLRAVWTGDIAAQLAKALDDVTAEVRTRETGDDPGDTRMASGLERGGRQLAAPIVERVLEGA